MPHCLGETVYPGLGNCISLVLYADNEPIEHSTISRVQVHIDDTAGTVIDSASEPSIFDWTAEQQLTMQLGLSSATLEQGATTAHLVVYTFDFPNGRRWEDLLQLTIQEAA